ncbi:MAG: peptide deformylase, partial [Candidatus Omnitrophota bacterium]
MSETALRVRIYGDPALRKKAKEVFKVGLEHREILSQMSRLMYEQSGIGLAAPQVGRTEAMIVVDVGQGLYKLINPKVVKRQGSQALEEGCLSIPGVCIKVKRADKIIVEALDDNGKKVSIQAQGLLACCLQHEIDHL